MLRARAAAKEINVETRDEHVAPNWFRRNENTSHDVKLSSVIPSIVEYKSLPSTNTSRFSVELVALPQSASNRSLYKIGFVKGRSLEFPHELKTTRLNNICNLLTNLQDVYFGCRIVTGDCK